MARCRATEPILSYSDHGGLLEAINRGYPVAVDRIELHRDMIGHVYFARGATRSYVLKLYRPHHAGNALTAAGIIRYLRGRGYPTVAIVPARTGQDHILIGTPDGSCVAILYEYVPGPEPCLETGIAAIGVQAAQLHALMDDYPGRLERRGKEFYIDRYIALLDAKGYPPARIRELEHLGARLWRSLERLPPGFCHGDFHTGNMVQSGPGEYVLLDFDAASLTTPVIDVAAICDGSDFNRLAEGAIERTMRQFEAFYGGYGKVRTLSDREITAILDFIPVRHYEIIATIVSCQGLDEVSRPFLDEQYDWLLRWAEMRERRSSGP